MTPFDTLAALALWIPPKGIALRTIRARPAPIAALCLTTTGDELQVDTGDATADELYEALDCAAMALLTCRDLDDLTSTLTLELAAAAFERAVDRLAERAACGGAR